MNKSQYFFYFVFIALICVYRIKKRHNSFQSLQAMREELTNVPYDLIWILNWQYYRVLTENLLNLNVLCVCNYYCCYSNLKDPHLQENCNCSICWKSTVIAVKNYYIHNCKWQILSMVRQKKQKKNNLNEIKTDFSCQTNCFK